MQTQRSADRCELQCKSIKTHNFAPVHHALFIVGCLAFVGVVSEAFLIYMIHWSVLWRRHRYQVHKTTLSSSFSLKKEKKNTCWCKTCKRNTNDITYNVTIIFPEYSLADTVWHLNWVKRLNINFSVEGNKFCILSTSFFNTQYSQIPSMS